MNPPKILAVAASLTMTVSLAWSADLPRTVSPGSPERVARAGERCPTFSWAAVPGAAAYRLAVYDVSDETHEPQLVATVDLPGTASSWTPSAEQGLLPGRTYAWRVGAVGPHGTITWSSPSWFEVAALPVESRPPGSEPRANHPAPVARPLPAAAAASYFAVGNGGAMTAGAVTATSFTGDGAGLTNLLWSHINNVPLDLADGDDDTTCNGQPCDGRYFTNLQWTNLDNRPAGLDDGDDDTTYTAGSGLTLQGNQFALAGPDNSRPGHTATTMSSDGSMAMTVGADGLGFIVDIHYGTELRAIHCSNLACTAFTTAVVTMYALLPAVTVGADGLPLISFWNGNDDSLGVAHCNDAACTSATISTPDSGGVGRASSITIGVDGLGLISYREHVKGDLKVAHCSDIPCTVATIATLDPSTGSLSYTSVSIGPDGLGLIAYDKGNRMWVAHCNDATCSSATLSNPAPSDYIMVSSLTIGSDGLGLASGTALTDGLKVAHCNNIACTAATIATLDSTSAAGGTSISIGADGLGLISYFDSTNQRPKVAHCSDIPCTAATTTTLASTGYESSSLTIGTDGLPLVARNDLTSGQLAVTHCANPFCIPYFRRR